MAKKDTQVANEEATKGVNTNAPIDNIGENENVNTNTLPVEPTTENEEVNTTAEPTEKAVNAAPVETTAEPVLTKEQLRILADAKKYGIVPGKNMTIDQILYEFERVPFQAFYDGEKYKDDLHVGLNGRMTIIQRGVPVQIPRCLLRVIKTAEDNKKSANLKMREYIEAYQKSREQLS